MWKIARTSSWVRTWKSFGWRGDQFVAAAEEVADLGLGLGDAGLLGRLRGDRQAGPLAGVHLQRGGVGDQDDVVLAQAEEAPLLGEDADDPEPVAVDHQVRLDQVVARPELAGDVAADHADPVPLLDVDHAEGPTGGDLVIPDARVLGRDPFQDRRHLGPPRPDGTDGRRRSGETQRRASQSRSTAMMSARSSSTRPSVRPASPSGRSGQTHMAFVPNPCREPGHVAGQPLDHADDRDGRGHRDHHAEDRQRRPRLVRPELLDRRPEVGRDEAHRVGLRPGRGRPLAQAERLFGARLDLDRHPIFERVERPERPDHDPVGRGEPGHDLDPALVAQPRLDRPEPDLVAVEHEDRLDVVRSPPRISSASGAGPPRDSTGRTRSRRLRCITAWTGTPSRLVLPGNLDLDVHPHPGFGRVAGVLEPIGGGVGDDLAGRLPARGDALIRPGIDSVGSSGRKIRAGWSAATRLTSASSIQARTRS